MEPEDGGGASAGREGTGAAGGGAGARAKAPGGVGPPAAGREFASFCPHWAQHSDPRAHTRRGGAPGGGWEPEPRLGSLPTAPPTRAGQGGAGPTAPSESGWLPNKSPLLQTHPLRRARAGPVWAVGQSVCNCGSDTARPRLRLPATPGSLCQGLLHVEELSGNKTKPRSGEAPILPECGRADAYTRSPAAPGGASALFPRRALRHRQVPSHPLAGPSPAPPPRSPHPLSRARRGDTGLHHRPWCPRGEAPRSCPVVGAIAGPPTPTHPDACPGPPSVDVPTPADR